MINGWYILNYHDVSWEENEFVRGLGGSYAPKEFREHVKLLKQYFKLMSVDEAFQLYKDNAISEPIVSFWFDDGFVGNRKYAFPILEKEGVKAAISVNSRFLLRQELFWRFKLSYLHYHDGDRFLRTKFRKRGIEINKNLKDLTFKHFSDELLQDIDSVYNDMTTEEFRLDAFRIFDDVEGINYLRKNGWLIANHSAGHYPITEEAYKHEFLNQFWEGDHVLKEYLNVENDYWVIPFDRIPLDDFNFQTEDANKILVMVGNKVNKSDSNSKALNRINITDMYGADLIDYLEKIETK
jgi:peptidoglycan/xylan/chitin deacetylase (PgdA/CDA1 family)